MSCRSALVFVALMAIVVTARASAQNQSKAASAERTLEVKLNYIGAGTVDQTHQIYVMVTDSDPFTSEVLANVSDKPAGKNETSAAGQTRKICYILARQGAAAKDQVLTFSGITVSSIYVVAFYDKSGTNDGQSEPASGSPTGLYGTKPGQPDPVKIEQGRTVRIVVTFDDSSTVP